LLFDLSANRIWGRFVLVVVNATINDTTSADETNGQGSGEKWFVVGADGRSIKERNHFKIGSRSIGSRR
jgi:hypothetical protein